MKKSRSKLTNTPSAIFLTTENSLRIQGIIVNSISVYVKIKDFALQVTVLDKVKMVSKLQNSPKNEKKKLIELQLIYNAVLILGDRLFSISLLKDIEYSSLPLLFICILRMNILIVMDP